MKKITLLNGILLILILFSCSSDDDSTPVNNQTEELSLSRMVIEESFDFGQTYPQLITRTFENNLPIVDSTFSSEIFYLKTVYNYDVNDNLISLEFFDDNNLLTSKYEYLYDSNERIINIHYEEFEFNFTNNNTYNYNQPNQIVINNGEATILYNSDNLVTQLSNQNGYMETATYNGNKPVVVTTTENNISLEFEFTNEAYKGGFEFKTMFNNNLLNTYLNTDGLRSSGSLIGVGNSSKLNKITRTYNDLNQTQTINFEYIINQNGYLTQINESSNDWSGTEISRTTFEYE